MIPSQRHAFVRFYEPEIVDHASGELRKISLCSRCQFLPPSLRIQPVVDVIARGNITKQAAARP